MVSASLVSLKIMRDRIELLSFNWLQHSWCLQPIKRSFIGFGNHHVNLNIFSFVACIIGIYDGILLWIGA